ncbi:ankyrin repeat-containing domain protein [Dendryphion nanum]|uniref:Ankyrin repeat-containing domain protein n=1 Tax=Dendryphion nanum TaxID=256645 RepID=A0A9P9EIV1_9PLEO|nr:ankyrin repeat-containing domain protein [Dendryphion nanum]
MAEIATKPKKTTYENIEQGIKELYPKGDKEYKGTNPIDVVFVPGLGANPEESWLKGKFNWASDKNGLVKEYPNARVLLYQCESAFHGSLKVEQFLDNLALGLVDGLQSYRGDQIQRPLVFIGHSMGGLVIAKAVTIMDARRDIYPKMFEATAGCIFFGSPFLGAEAASVAAMFANVAEKFGVATTSKLLDMMKPGDEALRELRGEFLRLANKLNPKIEIHCFWEEQTTDVAEMAAEFIKKRDTPNLAGRVSGALFDLFKAATEPFKIVNRESATFENAVSNSGLAANHRNLVKFEDPKESRYQLMRAPLKRIVHGALLIAKNRVNSVRDVDLEVMKNITKALSGNSAPAKRKLLEKKFTSSSWLPTEKEFSQWLAAEDDPHDSTEADTPRGDCLWICGAEGRGKTGATIAAIHQIEKTIASDKHVQGGIAPILLVYFFCDPVADSSTAEELLKSLVWQLTQEQPLFASYAKQFTKREGKNPVSLSVENLWQSLQDMFSDKTASSRIYVVINNLHHLADESDSTRKLMELIRGDIDIMNNEETSRTSVRWLFTSRKAKVSIDANLLQVNTVRIIDLEDDKYVDQVQLELRKHAQKKVASLAAEKKYKKDLAYFVSSLIGNRAKNTGWIDTTVLQLEEIPEAENPFRVRQVLKVLPQELDDLLDASWQQIFTTNPEQVDKIKEMLRALVLTYEDPSLEELAILAGFPSDEQSISELRSLVELCASFLITYGTDSPSDIVYFKNDISKPHLLRHAKKLLGLSEEEIQWQQGELALRAFTHLLERYVEPEVEKESDDEDDEGGEKKSGDDEEDEKKSNVDEAEKQAEGDEGEKTETGEEEHKEDEEAKEPDAVTNDGEASEKHEDDANKEETNDANEDSDDSDDDSDDTAEPETAALPYMAKHWLHHAAKATVDMAEELSREEDFWKKDSPIRNRWQRQYQHLIGEDWPTDTWTALHVTSAWGYRHLVSALIRNGHLEEITVYDSLTNAPLHLAAYFSRPNIVEELLYRGAGVNDGESLNCETPLSMASYYGNTKVMKLLINSGAHVNAADNDVGPLINNAIRSGNFQAVELLVENKATLSYESNGPLEVAASLPDQTIFKYLMDAGKAQLQDHDYDAAFVAAAYAGNAEVFDRLLDEHEHSNEVAQRALQQATQETEWGIVRKILEHYQDLDCNDLFKAVATSAEDLNELLDTVWQYSDGKITQTALDDALYEATDNEKESTVRKLLELGASANATGEVYGNALTAAAYDGTINMVKMLLDAGAEIESDSGWALQTAAGEGHTEVVLELLSRGANVNSLTTDHRFPQGTALQAAVESSKESLVELLLEKGADPNLGAGEYTCPIIGAARKAEADILAIIVKAGAKINVFGGSDGSTPLINAAMFLHRKDIEVLVDHGADVNLADPDGDTALIMCALYQDTDSVTYLLEKGADVKHYSKSRKINALQAAFEGGNQECLKVVIDHVSKMISGDQYEEEEKETEEKDEDGADSEATGGTHDSDEEESEANEGAQESDEEESDDE